MPRQLGNNEDNGGRRRKKNKWPGEPLFVLLFGSPGEDNVSALSHLVNCELCLQGEVGRWGAGGTVWGRGMWSADCFGEERGEQSGETRARVLFAVPHLIGWLTHRVRS